MSQPKTAKELTVEQLRKQLITADYGGIEWKTKCLDELLIRLGLDIANSFKDC